MPRTILLIGGNSGIGWSTARQLIAQGDAVIAATRSSVIAPSLTDTPLAGTLLNNDAKREAAAKRHPLQQIGDPDDTAALVTFLLSGASKFLSGQVLRPDGGLSSLRTF